MPKVTDEEFDKYASLMRRSMNPQETREFMELKKGEAKINYQLLLEQEMEKKYMYLANH